MTYFFMFCTALISATLFPLGSEGLLVYYLSQNHIIVMLLISATLGNTLGSIINYKLGIKGEEFLEEKNYLSSKKITTYSKYFKKYGGFILLFSWLPIVGDPITFIAGMLRYDFKKFIFIVLVAKFCRYLIVVLSFKAII